MKSFILYFCCRLRLLLAAACISLITGFSITAIAKEFDRNLQAPKPITSAELETKVREYISGFEDGSVTWIDALKDDALFEQSTTLKWYLNSALEPPKGSLPDLSEFGLTLTENDIYKVDYQNFPQWYPLDEAMGIVFAKNLDEPTTPTLASKIWFVKMLEDRGFRESDLQTLSSYLDNNNYEAHRLRAEVAETGPMVSSFAKYASERTNSKGRIKKEDFAAYWYQEYLNRRFASRQWALNLLENFDMQRQRILISAIKELEITVLFYPIRTDSDETWADIEHQLLDGRKLQQIRRNETKLQKYNSARMEAEK